MSDVLDENLMRQIEEVIGINAETSAEATITTTTSTEATINNPQISAEEQFIKAKFIEELFALAEKVNKENAIPKRANEANIKKDEQAIRLYTRTQIAQIISTLQITDAKEKKPKNYYHWRNTFALSDIQPVQLIKKENNPEKFPIPRVVVAAEDMYEICLKIHTNVGFQGQSPMEKEAKKYYYNVTRPIILVFLKYSEEYQVKRRRIKTASQVINPIISDYFNSRAQVDLVDMSSLPDNSVDPPYKYIFNCQDHLTKFSHLIPMLSKTAEEVAMNLYKIFCLQGAPIILQSDNGREFRNQVCYALHKLWPGLKILHGRSRKPSTQGSVERCNGDFQNMLGSWMRKTKSSRWSLGLPLVQYQKNSKYHRGIGMSPMCAVYGRESYAGLDILNLPDENKENINSVKDLYRLITGN